MTEQRTEPPRCRLRTDFPFSRQPLIVQVDDQEPRPEIPPESLYPAEVVMGTNRIEKLWESLIKNQQQAQNGCLLFVLLEFSPHLTRQPLAVKEVSVDERDGQITVRLAADKPYSITRWNVCQIEGKEAICTGVFRPVPSDRTVRLRWSDDPPGIKQRGTRRVIPPECAVIVAAFINDNEQQPILA